MTQVFHLKTYGNVLLLGVTAGVFCAEFTLLFRLMLLQILANPFEDIIPRTLPTKAEKGSDERKKSTSKATK